jgi:hypothetical protein
VEDVVIGEYRRPWNARPEAARLAKGVPKASLWAHLPGGIEQIGCIYTAQGFEFDYVGVIFGTDLLYRFDRQDWIGDREQSYDTVVKRSGGKFSDLVKIHASSSFKRNKRVLRPFHGQRNQTFSGKDGVGTVAVAI